MEFPFYHLRSRCFSAAPNFLDGSYDLVLGQNFSADLDDAREPHQLEEQDVSNGLVFRIKEKFLLLLYEYHLCESRATLVLRLRPFSSSQRHRRHRLLARFQF